MDKSCRLNELFEQSFINNHTLNLFSDYNGEIYTYEQIAEKINRLHQFYQYSGIEPGDKIALIGRNSSNWGLVFLSVITYGSVIVPILPDFNTVDIQNIINHSESKYLFAADAFIDKIDKESLTAIEGTVNLTTMTMVSGNAENWNKAINESCSFDINTFRLKELKSDHLCALSYTSGTIGHSKGVMIPAGSLYSNILYSKRVIPFKPKDTVLSFLPMAHIYGLLFDFLYPVTVGCHITFLTKPPSPQILIKALKEDRKSVV